MATLDAYNKAIDKMVADTNVRLDEAVGWTKPRAPMVANADAMKASAYSIDQWNPLFYDETYAAGTRWGGLIAYPMTGAGMGNTINTTPSETPDCGFDYQLWVGQDWDFYRPIRPGDTFKVWNRRGQLMERTTPGVKEPRAFAMLECDCDTINQRDELVTTVKTHCMRTFFREGPPKPINNMPEYGYTHEELLYIDKMVRAEEIRGANPRYWEDVKIGDETKPAVLGPTNMSDNSMGGGGFGMGMPAPPRVLLSKAPEVDPMEFAQEGGLYYKTGGDAARHWSDHAARAQGEPVAFLFCVKSVYTMLRVIVNWMGDDGFLRKYHWRHIMRTPVGDCNIGHGKVLNKRVENGEYLVDLVVWLENMRGVVTEASSVTVSLLSKEAGYNWK